MFQHPRGINSPPFSEYFTPALGNPVHDAVASVSSGEWRKSYGQCQQLTGTVAAHSRSQRAGQVPQQGLSFMPYMSAKLDEVMITTIFITSRIWGIWRLLTSPQFVPPTHAGTRQELWYGGCSSMSMSTEFLNFSRWQKGTGLVYFTPFSSVVFIFDFLS